MIKNFSRWIQDAWYKEMYLSTWIMPLSMIYVDIIKLRRFLYRKGFLKTTRLPVPVIIVGNITVGGTGKTPLVIWLADYLQQQGYKPGIISRGYGGSGQEQPLLVTANSPVADVGDEPLLIARKSTAPVAVCARRVAAAKYLIDDFHCDVIISDDGLQHYALQRDIEIAVIDGLRRFGNGYCLPAGPLREPIERLQEVDLVIVNGEVEQDDEYSMRFSGSDAVNLANQTVKPLSEFSQQPCHAVAGIGNPERFFQLLKQQGVTFDAHAFPDHYHFTAADLNFKDECPVLMTEKDAVKCQSFATEKLWSVPVTAEPEPSFIQQLNILLTQKHG